MFLFVPDGPYRKPGQGVQLSAFFDVFKSNGLRSAAFGYFGHMWELYTLWAFMPLLLLAYANQHNVALDVSRWAFLFIAVGSLGCIVGGIASMHAGSARVAACQLAVSGTCCLLVPLMIDTTPFVFLGFILLWGITVIGDSPQFSAMNARYAPREYVGSALTMVNSIGFLLTIVSIQLASWLLPLVGIEYLFWLLLPGPVFGLWALRPLWRER